MNPQQRQKWAQIRRMGKYRYLLVYGILLWGVPVALCYAVATTLVDNGFSIQPVLSSPLLRRLFVAKVFISLLLFPVGGSGVAWWLWEYYEKKYLDE